MDVSRTDATRYLCAGAYLDNSFRDRVIEQCLEEPHRALASTPGVDLATVARHCLAARSRKTRRDLILGGLLILGFILAVSAEDPWAAVPCVVAAWAVVFWTHWRTTYGIVASRLSRKAFDPAGSAPWPSGRLRETLRRLEDVRDSNVIMSGGFSPFPGSGLDIGGWSFVVDLKKGKEEIERRLEPEPVAVEDLYEHTSAAIDDLGLDRVQIHDVLCVNGQDIRDDRRFLPDPYGRPVTSVDTVVIKEFVTNPTQAVRHYKCLRVVDWNGELVLSVFLRYTKLAQRLFVETSYFLLVPVREAFHQVDSLNATPTLRQWMGMLMGTAAQTPFLLTLSPLFVVGKIMHHWELRNKRREARRNIDENLTFNYGAITSIREAISDGVYRRYFQKLDKEMYLKMIERAILDDVIEFLDQKNIDTSDLRERKTTILNSGVIVSGGSIEAKNFAVGRGARALAARVNSAATSIGVQR